MQDTQRLQSIIYALPPSIQSHGELPDEASRLELDAYLQSAQPTLHYDIHSLPLKIIESPEMKDLYDPEGDQFVLSKLQLRGIIAASAIAGAEVALIRIGENLAEAQRLENQTLHDDDPSRSD